MVASSTDTLKPLFNLGLGVGNFFFRQTVPSGNMLGSVSAMRCSIGELEGRGGVDVASEAELVFSPCCGVVSGLTAKSGNESTVLTVEDSGTSVSDVREPFNFFSFPLIFSEREGFFFVFFSLVMLEVGERWQQVKPLHDKQQNTNK